MHPPVTLLNSGWIEHTDGKFLFDHEGVTNGVGLAVERVEAERVAIGKALGLDLPRMDKVLLEWYGHSGAKGEDLPAVMQPTPFTPSTGRPPVSSTVS